MESERKDWQKKGRKDAEKTGATNISDEMNCIMTIVYALANKRECVILTTDSDYLEIFFKAQWFLDTHYRSWLIGNLIDQGQYHDSSGQLDDTMGYFDGPLMLYPRTSTHLREVLPTKYETVRVGVLHFVGDGTLRKTTFPFEVQMLDMIKTRGENNGRCTGLFKGHNLHVELGPLATKVDRLSLGIGKDVTANFNNEGHETSVARLDLELSVNCRERFSRVGKYNV